jgi:hypothetical protein
LQQPTGGKQKLGAISKMGERMLRRLLGAADDGLSDLVRSLIRELQAELAELDRRIGIYDRRIRDIFRNSEPCQRLGKIEAGYTSAVVTIDPDPANLLQLGGVHIPPQMELRHCQQTNQSHKRTRFLTFPLFPKPVVRSTIGVRLGSRY